MAMVTDYIGNLYHGQKIYLKACSVLILIGLQIIRHTHGIESRSHNNKVYCSNTWFHKSQRCVIQSNVAAHSQWSFKCLKIYQRL